MIAIIGVGQLGSELVKTCKRMSLAHVAITHNDVDVEEFVCVNNYLDRLPIQPTTVINTAAYTDVDGCEMRRRWAYAVNATGLLTWLSGVMLTRLST